jgi:hypothetical protein
MYTLAAMTGAELRQRIDRLALTYRAAADALGLSLAGLNHQMRGLRSVGRQTELLLERLEADHERARKRTKRAAKP